VNAETSNPDGAAVVAAPAPAAAWPRSLVVGLALWSLGLSALSAAVALHIGNQRLEAALALRPPIVVVDPFEWIKSGGQGDTPEARYRDGAKRLQGAVQQLTGRGALVIDSTAVRGSPDSVRLNVVPPRDQP